MSPLLTAVLLAAAIALLIMVARARNKPPLAEAWSEPPRRNKPPARHC